MSLKLCPVECSACGELLGFSEPMSEDQALLDFYCEDCAVTFSAIEPIAISSLLDHAQALIGEVAQEQVEQAYPSQKVKPA